MIQLHEFVIRFSSIEMILLRYVSNLEINIYMLLFLNCT